LAERQRWTIVAGALSFASLLLAIAGIKTLAQKPDAPDTATVLAPPLAQPAVSDTTLAPPSLAPPEEPPAAAPDPTTAASPAPAHAPAPAPKPLPAANATPKPVTPPGSDAKASRVAPKTSASSGKSKPGGDPFGLMKPVRSKPKDDPFGL
jgi:hypothetical protein